jgi:CHAT domain-containing protein
LARRQAVATLTSVAGLAGKVSTAGPAHAKLTYGGFGNPILQGNPDDDRQQFAATQSLRKQRCESILKSNSAFGTTNATKPVRFVTSVLRGESSDTKAIKFLPPLPETADEICAAASIVGNGSAEVFLGNKYTETLVKELSKSQKLKNYSTLHFATHGLMAYETEKIVGERGEPALVATPPEVVTPEDDGLLTASEISNLDLSSDWVILSACNTASGERGDVEVLSGLARAFFFAGAKSILASHWAIDSYASKLLVGAMFVKGPRLSRPERSNALRSAMMSLLNGSEEAAAHPAIWAPFVIVESGAY